VANLEDHRKYPQFRVPGNVHLYFLRTIKLSFGTRRPFENVGPALAEPIRKLPTDNHPIVVHKG
jgi:hypothetical protein